MKTIKILAATFILAAAGVSNASIIGTYVVAVSGVTSGVATGSLTGSGTAIFDNSGLLTIDYTALNDSPEAGSSNPFTTKVTTIFTGTVSGAFFTTTAGTSEITDCTIGGVPCPPSFKPNNPHNLTPIPISGNGGGLLEQAFFINGYGTNTSTTYSFAHALQDNLTYSFGNACSQSFDCVPPIPTTTPLSGAAWFLGSGLVGLMGLTTRRLSS